MASLDRDDIIDTMVVGWYARYLKRPPESLAVVAQWHDTVVKTSATQALWSFLQTPEAQSHQASWG